MRLVELADLIDLDEEQNKSPSDPYMHLDLATVLNLISTLTLVGALVFTGLQLRASNRARRDQAAITVIQSAQSETWTQASGLIHRSPQLAEGSSEQTVPKVELALFTIGIRIEAVGYMVYERLVNLEAVDELMGGFTLLFWSRAKTWAKRRRVELGDPKAFEWCEWLALRIGERRSKTRSQPGLLAGGLEGLARSSVQSA
jgi:hypothetical protein